MREFSRSATVVPLCLLLVAGGCGGSDEQGGPMEEAGDAAETGAAMDGLTPDQIRAAAEPMTPAMAESLGIIDTTIHVEKFPGDSVVRPIPPPDTTGH